MGGLLDSVGSGIGSLFVNSVARIADAVSGAASQVTSLVPADPRVIAVGVLAILVLGWWLLRR